MFALVYQCLACLGVFAWYEANKQYIAEQLCENRDKPELHCNGQCVLMKKLRALEDDKHTNSDQSFSKLDNVVFIVPLLQRIFVPIVPPEYRSHFSVNESYQYLYSPDNFRPPRPQGS